MWEPVSAPRAPRGRRSHRVVGSLAQFWTPPCRSPHPVSVEAPWRQTTGYWVYGCIGATWSPLHVPSPHRLPLQLQTVCGQTQTERGGAPATQNTIGHQHQGQGTGETVLTALWPVRPRYGPISPHTASHHEPVLLLQMTLASVCLFPPMGHGAGGWNPRCGSGWDQALRGQGAVQAVCTTDSNPRPCQAPKPPST